MRFFTRQETVVVSILFLVVFLVTVFNMQTSLRRARDAQRRGDLGAITDALEKFKTSYGFFPASEDGKIKICKKENFDDVLSELKQLPTFDRKLFEEGLRGCNWGNDSISDVLDETGNIKPYLSSLPVDPKSAQGFDYYYLSSDHRFQIYTYLEGGADENGYDTRIVDRNLYCGIGICSYGRSYAVPIERDINDYELELITNFKKTPGS